MRMVWGGNEIFINVHGFAIALFSYGEFHLEKLAKSRSDKLPKATVQQVSYHFFLDDCSRRWQIYIYF